MPNGGGDEEPALTAAPHRPAHRSGDASAGTPPSSRPPAQSRRSAMNSNLRTTIFRSKPVPVAGAIRPDSMTQQELLTRQELTEIKHANVKLLLNESIKNVGRVGDIVEVSPGYARNYLLPRGAGGSAHPQQHQEDRSPPPGNRAAGARAPRAAGGDHQATGRRGSHAGAQGQRAGPPLRLGHARPTSPSRCRHRATTSTPTTSTCPASSIASTLTPCAIKFAEDLSTEMKVWVAPRRGKQGRRSIPPQGQGAAGPAASTNQREVITPSRRHRQRPLLCKTGGEPVAAALCGPPRRVISF